MRYEKSETLELGKAEELVLVNPIDTGIEENHDNKVPFTSSSVAAYLSEFDDE